MASGLAARAVRIAIPAIGVESDVAELAILDLGDSRQYETPKNVVGHIPETANPGESGNGWFFGHLESPIRGEGNVFRRLPEVPGLLKEYLETGDGPVYVFLSSPDGEFLYQVTETKVVHRDELALYDSGGPAITLVTCYPRFVYDQRVVVTAKLVGVKG
jgi:LPXTG-site transpeptidase (sortase) family protein